MPRTRCSRASSSTLGSAPRLVGGALGRGVRDLGLLGARTGLGAGLGAGLGRTVLGRTVLGRAFLGRAFLGGGVLSRGVLGGPGRPGLAPGSPVNFCQSPVTLSRTRTGSVGCAPTESQCCTRSEFTSMSEGSAFG